MSLLLFVLESFLVLIGISLVPAQSELRIVRARGIRNERQRGNYLRSYRSS